MIQLDERLGGQPRYSMTKEPRKLMLVPDHVRDCVIFVGFELKAGAIEPWGTAFLVARPIEGYWNYWITMQSKISKREGRSVEGTKSSHDGLGIRLNPGPRLD